MDTSRFEMLRHSLSAAPSRRAVGHGIIGVIIGGLLGSLRERPSAVAKRKRKKKRVNIPCPVCPVAATCPGACGSACELCLTRVGAPPVCGDSATKTCLTACSSDSDCAGTDEPYCVAQFFRASTGQTNNLCATPGGFCTNVLARC